MLPSLKVKIGADTTDLDRKLSDTQARLRRFAKLAAAATTLVAGATAALFTRTAQAIDEQAKLAQSLNTTVKSMQVLKRAGELAGVSMSGIAQATRDLERRLSQAAAGAGPAADSLNRLGLSAEDLLSMPLDKRIETINDAIEEFIPAAQRAAVASTLFGDRGAIAMGRIDSATLRQATQDVEDFGVAIGEDAADQIEAANDALTRVGMVFTGIANQITVALAPAVEALANGFADLMRIGSTFREVLEAIAGRVAAYGAVLASVAAGWGVYRGAVIAATVATRGFNVALGQTRAALLRTGIGAFVVLTGELIYQLGLTRSAANDSAEAQEELNRQLDIYAQTSAKDAGRAALELAQSQLASARATLAELEAIRSRAMNEDDPLVPIPGAAAENALDRLGDRIPEMQANVDNLARTVDALMRDGLGSGGDGGGVSTGLEETADAISSVTDQSYQAIPAISELRAQYGGLAGVAQEALTAQNELAGADMQQQIAGLVGQVTALGEELGLGSDKMALLVADFERMAANGSLQQQADQMFVLARYIAEASGGLEQMAPAVRAVYDEIIKTALGAAEVANQMNIARGQALGLKGAAAQIAGALWPAVDAAAALGRAIGGAMSRLGGLVSGMTGLSNITGAVSGALGMLGGTLGSLGRDALGAASSAFSVAVGNIRDLWTTAQSGAASVADLQAQLDGLFTTPGGGSAAGGGAIEEVVQGLTRVQEVAKLAAEATSTALGDAMMSIVDGTKSAAAAFKDMARIILKKAFELLVINPILNSIFGGVKGFNILPSIVPIPGAANGAVMNHGNIQAFASGGVVSNPTFFPMANGGTGLMGEAGPEAIMPLTRGADGRLGVKAAGGQGNVVINQTFAFTANGDDSVKAIIAEEAPKIAALTQKQMLDARRRGGVVRETFS